MGDCGFDDKSTIAAQRMGKMKYGAHVFLWQDCFDDGDLEQILDAVVRLELSFLEVPIGDDIQFDAERLGRQVAARGLELVLSPGGEWPMACDISLEDPRQRLAGIDWHRRSIDLTAKCAGKIYAGALYGHPGRVERGQASHDEQVRVADGLRELAIYAKQRGILLVLEPMSHFRTHLANTPRQINDLIRLAGEENLASLLDTYHLTTEVTDLAAAFDEMLPSLWGIHACENNRGAPGTGMLPWKRLVDRMSQQQWPGYIGFESYNSTWRDGEFARERGMFHHVCPDAETFIRQAKAFIESLLHEQRT